VYHVRYTGGEGDTGTDTHDSCPEARRRAERRLPSPDSAASSPEDHSVRKGARKRRLMRTKSEPPADDDGDSSDGFCGGAPQNERHLKGLLKSLEREAASSSKATAGRRHLGKRTDLLRGQPLLDMERGLGSPTSSGRSGLAQHLFFTSMHSTWSTSESENPSSTLNDRVKTVKKSSSNHATASSNGARGPAQASPTNGASSQRYDENCGDLEGGANIVLVGHGRRDDGVAALDTEPKWSMATKMPPPPFETIDEVSPATAANEARSASSTAAATDVPPLAFDEKISEGGSNPSSASCSVVDETESDPDDTCLVEGLEAVAKKEADASGHHVWYSSSGSNSGSDGVAKNTNSQRKSTAKRQADNATNPDSSHFVWNSDSSGDSSLERTKLPQDKTRHGR